jgi:hypothetical protein
MKETIEEAAERFYSEQSESYENAIEPTFDYSRYLVTGFIDGAKCQAEKMYSDIEQKWLEYRSITNNEDAWSFKQWLIEQFKKK